MKAKTQRQEFLFILPLSNRKKNIDQSSALYSVKVPFERVHANVVDIRVFFSKSAVSTSSRFRI